MWLRDLVSKWHGGTRPSISRPSLTRPRLTVLALEGREVPAALTLGAMGDSFTAAYTTDPVIPGVLDVRGEYNWVDQLRLLRPGGVTIHDEAVVGSTSTELVAGQLPTVAALAADGAIRYAVVETGGADALFQFSADILRGKPEAFIDTVAANVRTAADTLSQAEPVRVVIADIPDVTVTPYFLANVTSNHTHVRRMSDAIRAANDRILDLAAARGIPVVDLDGLFRLTQQPLTLGGVSLTGQFTPDGLHPRTALQGVLADTVLEALNEGYGENVTRLRLSDQEILDAAGVAHAPGRTFFDVRPFVILGGGRHTGAFSTGFATGPVGHAAATASAVGNVTWGGPEGDLRGEAEHAASNPSVFVSIDTHPAGSRAGQSVGAGSVNSEADGLWVTSPATIRPTPRAVYIGGQAASLSSSGQFDDVLELIPCGDE